MWTLHKVKGMDIGKTYHNSCATSQFTHYSSQAEREKRRNATRAASLDRCGLVAGKPTGSSATEQEIVYCRFARKEEEQRNWVAVSFQS